MVIIYIFTQNVYDFFDTLDYFDTKYYNKCGDVMENFMKYDFNIDKISLVGFVPSGEGTPVHVNRKTHGLVMYTGGEIEFEFDGKKYPVKKNDIIYLPKYTNYTAYHKEYKKETGCYVINFDITEEKHFKPFVFQLKNSASFLNMFMQSENIWRTKRSGFNMKCKANLYNIICDMRKEYELGYIAQDVAGMIENAVVYIHKNYTKDNISINYLASLCGMSETYFRRIFKKSKGISPLKYINKLKISRAEELLVSKMYSVSEIALLSGFHDEAYFSREFKKATGVSPSQYV